MNYPIFKCRASASGKLMTNPRTKNELLSETTKTYVKEWLAEKIYGYKKEIKSKYLDRGIKQEDIAIDKAIEWLDLPFAIKNEGTFEDEYFTGTPDLIVNDTVFDIKCSWDCFTFPLFEEEIPNKDYYYQLQVYMYLTGCKKAVLTYVLLNNEEEKHNYDKMDKLYRIKIYRFDFDETVITDLKNRIINVNNYIQSL